MEGVFLIRSPMGDVNRPLCLGGTCVVWCAAKTLSPAHLTATSLACARRLSHAATHARENTALDVNSLEKGIPRFRSPEDIHGTVLMPRPHAHTHARPPRRIPRMDTHSPGQRTTHGVPARALALRSERQVCAASKCSVFYTKRICADCLSRPEIAAQMPSPAAPASAAASAAVRAEAAVPQPKAAG